jgi:hypothetical protein
MHPNSSLKEAIFPYLAGHEFLISAAGIRYGSVAYLAFGQGTPKEHQGRATTTQYPIELEIGSDDWNLMRDGTDLIDSKFDNVDRARERLQELLVGRKISDINSTDNESRIVFDDGMSLCSRIGSEPASGFLYSFQAERGPTWETIDGIALEE